MANKKRKCRWCGQYSEAEKGSIVGLMFFCNETHRINWAMDNTSKALAKIRENKKREANAKRKEQKIANRTRSQWFDILQKLVNQWVLHVRDKDKPCCTCGTTNPGIKYDAGHYRSRGACAELRFELTNIHKQCSVKCNVHGSGMRAEYREFIISEYGQDRLIWLDGEHPKLKDQFKTIEDIEGECKRYRKLISAAGLKPRG